MKFVVPGSRVLLGPRIVSRYRYCNHQTMLEKIDQIESEATAALAEATDAEKLERFRIMYLGSKGVVKNLMALLKEVPKEQKPQFGKRANALRQSIQASYETRKAEIGSARHPATVPSSTSPYPVTRRGLGGSTSSPRRSMS